MSAPVNAPTHLLAAWEQANSNGISGLLYVTSMDLSAGLPVLPQSSTGRALLLAALKSSQKQPPPDLAVGDVAVALDSAAGSNGTAAVNAFGSSQPGIFLIAVRAAPQMSLLHPKPDAPSLCMRDYRAGDLACGLHRAGHRQPAQYSGSRSACVHGGWTVHCCAGPCDSLAPL